MNTAPLSVTSEPEFSPPSLNRMRMTSAFLRKLSLNAEKNWHQNSGAKRRVARRFVAMARGPFGLTSLRADLWHGNEESVAVRKLPRPPRQRRGSGVGYLSARRSP